MTISDAYVDVTCDKCHDVERMELDYVYFDYSGENGAYDTSESGLESLLIDHGWVAREDDKHICPQCQDEDEDEDEVN